MKDNQRVFQRQMRSLAKNEELIVLEKEKLKEDLNICQEVLI